MIRFRRAYIASLVILGVLFLLNAIASLSDGRSGVVPEIYILVLPVVAMIPILLKGGIAQHPKLAFGISSVLAMLFAVVVYIGSMDYLATGGEGPKGEGAPIGAVLEIAYVALAFFCPWFLTALRGFAALRQKSKLATKT